jgi:hypothetical protein
MDPTRDNPILRFNTFWWALWTFLIFAVLLGAILIANRKPPTNLEDAAAVARYETKQRILKAQAAALSSAEIEAAIPTVAATLHASKPAAVETPAQVVPGSPTALQLAAATAAAPAAAAPNGAPASAGESPAVSPPVPAVTPETGGQDARPTPETGGQDARPTPPPPTGSPAQP